ncbi:hypothetical protein ANCCEY_12543 [Ancylostoma ceylanicum]|uniref:Uncharacterized protein n=1 Tax=Ancylostoma ceylanicum TaxID=53326 RepID=A0A0D6LEP2_9BILA|nr:hypothetical protein ANCCEY_12543 [Ancylostoma ceylanicum]
MAIAERDQMMSAPPPVEPPRTREPAIPPGLEDLSEEERRQILAVMAAAEADSVAPPAPPPQIHRSGSAITMRPSPSTSSVRDAQIGRPKSAMDRPAEPSDVIDLPGLEGLSAEEREQILAVMESARRDAEGAAPATAAPKQSAGPATLAFAPPLQPPTPSPTPIPPGLEELSAEEREKIMAVMASAAMDEQMSLPVTPSAQPSPQPWHEPEPSKERVTAPEPAVIREELPERPVEVIDDSDLPLKDSHDYVSGSPERRKTSDDLTGVGVPPIWDHDKPAKVSTSKPPSAVDTFGTIEEPRRSIPKEQPRPYEVSRDDSVDDEIPGVDLSHLSPSEREQIRAVMRMAQMDDPGAQRRRETSQRTEPQKPDSTAKPDADKRTRQQSMTSSSELGSPTRESGYGTTSTSYDRELGDFATRVREKSGAKRVCRGCVPRIADATFQTERMYDVLEDAGEKLFYSSLALLPSLGLRHFSDICTTLEQDGSDYDGADYALKEIEFDTGLTPSTKSATATKSSANTWTPMGLDAELITPMKRPTPEITVTVHDDKLDSEDEESGSEDDDEYPDKVVAAPIAPTPSYEEVEQERQRQEQFGKEVLQQIQAFGEAADDEFDVQWAKSTLQKSQASRDSVDMEEVDVTRAAQFYQTHSLFCHRPGPVYTIPEDVNERDGTLDNSESRMIGW